jgi:hypothetical protein
MLSGKFDLAFHSNLEKKHNEADYERRRISRAADAASNAPPGSERNSRAANLAKEVDRLRKSTNRYATALAIFPTNPQLSPTNASHIFAESINANIDVENKVSNRSIYASSYSLLIFSQKAYAAGIWAVMDQLGHSSFRDELDGAKIHKLSNILTLDVSLHTNFDGLDLWLEADPVGLTIIYHIMLISMPGQAQAHTYRICGLQNVIRDLPATVTFTTQHPSYEFPDPRYLKMHAACCRVAHMSGAAGYVADILDDLDEGETRVLSEDGLSANLLDFALLGRSSMIP